MFEKRKIDGETYISVGGGASERGWFSLDERAKPDWERVKETKTIALPEESRRISSEIGFWLIREGRAGDHPITYGSGKTFLYPVVLEVHQKEPA